MLSWDILGQTLNSIKQQKRRNILTGFGVAWGIFILVILLSVGKGFQSGIMQLFGSFAQNSIWLYGGQSSDVNIGKTEGKYILFKDSDLDILKKRFPEIKSISPEIKYEGNSIISYNDNHGIFSIKGINENYFEIKIINVDKGRLFNKFDNKEKRKVVIIGNKVKTILFKKDEPIGDFIKISDTWFKVIGILETGSIFNQNEQNSVYMPYNVLKETYNQGNEFNVVGLTLKPNIKTAKFEQKLKSFLAKYFNFDKFDEKALFVFNFEEQVKSFSKLFTGINIFLWMIGIALLLSGIVGVSNIMLVIVKERTKEIGIRKSLGAKYKSIMFMILSESILITLIAGIVGLILGVFFIVLINLIISNFFEQKELLISNLNINVTAIFGAVFLLVIAGMIAGFIPAKKAVEIEPIKALNYDSN